MKTSESIHRTMTYLVLLLILYGF